MSVRSDPRKAKSVRRYYDDDFDTRSTGSSGSMFSWASGTSQVYLVETTAPYWYWDDDSDAVSYSSSSKRKSSKRGRSSRTSHRSNHPTGTWARRATVEDEDEDDSCSDGSMDDYGGQPAAPFPHPGMIPPQGPPPGAFQPCYGMPPYSQHPTPGPTPPHGYPPPPPPPPPGGHFVPGRGGIQVFVDG
ncbi:hypothetical protein C8A03DRAFT_40830 [Achaetomium macrosporum]|uniref:Uncharacterized protein n=1 Tax=Achaetomium macrosporum TaxID=79813 RepID=A0AAN7CH78_9PEZI|nr:hypothetical protein C8A03DRAFT_40830 [Achaetomium macrosporum]